MANLQDHFVGFGYADHRSYDPVTYQRNHRRASALADLAFVSTAFPSESPSAGRPMGAFRLAAFAQCSDMPVYALGGINTRTVKRLEKLGVSGVGAIGALSSNR